MINKSEETKKILRLLSRANLTRQQLNQHLRIRVSTLQHIINGLISEGVIAEPGRHSARTGAKAHELSINPSCGNLIGIDFGATQTRVILSDFNGKCIAQYKGAYGGIKEKSAGLEEIFSIINQVQQEHPELWGKTTGIGFSDPGPVNPLEGISLQANNILNWKNVPVEKIFSEKYNLPAALISASQAKGLLESYTESKESQSLFVADMGKGVGAAWIYHGEVYFGSTYTGMEFGHTMAAESGAQCVCGKRGCLEAEVGSGAIERKFKARLADGAQSSLRGLPVTAETIILAAQEGDSTALDTIRESAHLLAKSLSYVIQMINPEKIVIDGMIAQLQDKLISLLLHHLGDYCPAQTLARTKITCSLHDEFASARGAALWVREKLLYRK